MALFSFTSTFTNQKDEMVVDKESSVFECGREFSKANCKIIFIDKKYREKHQSNSKQHFQI